MKILNQTAKLISIDKVSEHPENPRRGDVRSIARSIRINGFHGHLIVQKSTNYILAGNHRWKAAKILKAKEIPVVFVDVDDETARRILLADNKTADRAEWDKGNLAKMLNTIMEDVGHLAGTSFDDSELDDLLGIKNTKDRSGNDTISATYEIVIKCGDENQQLELLEKFISEGLDCRALTA